MTKAMENTNSRKETGTMMGTDQKVVYSKTAYISEPKEKYGNQILAVAWSLIMIMGGASGNMVLRGTNSSPALVIAGFAFLAFDVLSIIKTKKNYEKEMEKWHNINKDRGIKEQESARDKRELSGPARVRIICDQGTDLADYGALLNGSWMKRYEKKYYIKETSKVHNILGFKHLDLTVTFDIENIQESEVTFRLFKEGGRIGIAVPQGLLLDEAAHI